MFDFNHFIITNYCYY